MFGIGLFTLIKPYLMLAGVLGGVFLYARCSIYSKGYTAGAKDCREEYRSELEASEAAKNREFERNTGRTKKIIEKVKESEKRGEKDEAVIDLFNTGG